MVSLIKTLKDNNDDAYHFSKLKENTAKGHYYHLLNKFVYA